MEVVGCPRAQVVSVPEPPPVPSFSKVQRQSSLDEKGIPAPRLEEREGPGTGLGQVPSAVGLGWPCTAWNSHNSCHMTRSVPDGTVCVEQGCFPGNCAVEEKSQVSRSGKSRV